MTQALLGSRDVGEKAGSLLSLEPKMIEQNDTHNTLRCLSHSLPA